MAYDTNSQGFLTAIKTVVNDVVRLLNNNGDNQTGNTLDVAINRLNAVWRNVGRMSSSYPEYNLLLEDLQRLIQLTEEAKVTRQESIGLKPSTVGGIGRPRYHISREQLEFLVEMGFSAKVMARLLHVSLSSIKRRLSAYRISLRKMFTTMSDDELDDRVRNITDVNKSLGQRMVLGILRTQGVIVQRERVAESLIRVDAAAVAIRWCRTIRRRSYSVSGPNALWHIDGNHKLIRWGMVIHGGIDGYSRMIVHLNVALDNKAATAFAPFAEACQEFGVPSRVRTDHGLENVDIGSFMLAYRGANRGSMITGRSVHNQRIERMWRDMFQSCTHVFYYLFNFLEEQDLLNINNPIQLWCLQFIFVPRIKSALKTFQDGWNVHRVSSEGGKTPKQMFVEGVLGQVGQGHCGIDDLFVNEEPIDQLENYGIDWNGPVPENDPETVSVPTINCPLNNDQLQLLRNEVDLVNHSADLGISLYLKALLFCFRHVNCD